MLNGNGGLRVVRLPEAARMLGCSVRTVYRRSADGTLPSIIHPSPGIAGISYDELTTFIRSLSAQPVAA